MRIIAGKYKGRRLFVPEGRDVRPTSDRARESLFNLLMHGAYGGDAIIGQVVADLCCGTGALGLEALSRGAEKAIFVDQAKAALALAQKNAAHVGAEAQCLFIPADAAQLPKAPQPCALVMLDAPYHSPWLPRALKSVVEQGWLAAEGILSVEQARDEDGAQAEGLEMIDERRYGKAVIRLYRLGDKAAIR
jgi:16S rRNA (guanine966-N2)-methyltransferase